jgi:hypothetical protein
MLHDPPPHPVPPSTPESDRVKVFTVAHLPPDLARAFVQYVRNFDVEHPGCHFEIGADCPTDLSLSEMVEMCVIDPALSFAKLFKRGNKT